MTRWQGALSESIVGDLIDCFGFAAVGLAATAVLQGPSVASEKLDGAFKALYRARGARAQGRSAEGLKTYDAAALNLTTE